MIYDPTKTLKEHEAEILRQAIKHHGWDVRVVAKQLGVGKTYAYKIMRQAGIKKEKPKLRLMGDLTTDDVRTIFKSCDFNKLEMARKMKCSRTAIYRLLFEHNLHLTQNEIKQVPSDTLPRINQSCGGVAMTDEEIKIKEVVRAVDAFLIKFNCPLCKEENLSGFPPSECQHCQNDLKSYIPNVVGADRRILAPAIKKSANRIGKKKVLGLLKMQSYQCAYCDCSVAESEYHVDHIIPFIVGGSNNIHNLAIACSRCNLMAGAKCFAGYAQKREWIRSRILSKQALKLNTDKPRANEGLPVGNLQISSDAFADAQKVGA